MTFEELDKMWHDIREEIAAEEAGLTPEEWAARQNELVEKYAEKYGLKTGPSPETVEK